MSYNLSVNGKQMKKVLCTNSSPKSFKKSRESA